MKKYVLFFLILTGLSATSFAHVSSTSLSYARNQISKQIGKNFSFPEKLKEEVAGKSVKVSFTVSPEGRIEIGDMDTAGPELQDYIRRQMGKIVLENGIYEPGQLYLINLKFSVL